MSENDQVPERKAKRPTIPVNQIGQFYLPTLLIIGLILLLRIATTSPAAGSMIDIPGEEILDKAVGYTVLACELFAVLIIGLAAVQALFNYFGATFKRQRLTQQISSTESIRLRLGHKLSLGLEFAVAADILRLAISPSFADLLVLFAIILLRILLNYFLEHDIHTIREYNLVPELTENEENLDAYGQEEA
ncbi:MAG: DUF1622 domain-containing protein [Anaerolineaceae bacterium]|nr:DUF1622 domain-containing protein [Anaerolineaceae bacterium]